MSKKLKIVFRVLNYIDHLREKIVLLAKSN